MSLTDKDIRLIRESFGRVAPISGLAGELFYGRLFTIAPELQPLFKGDTKEQGTKLMQALAFMVKGLSNPGAVLPFAADLARRHVGYGVQAEHYQPVGIALLSTLKTALDEAFTPEVERAWERAYELISQAMIAAAYGLAPASDLAAE
ncbi:MAG TPA: globin family protein [Paracoccaceae bacterium]|nr:globin family protein [Paracoccaceae bacterium]